MLKALLSPFVRILPPTIHPMVVHFPIAFLYATAVVELLMWLSPTESRRFLGRAGFWLLTASCVAIVAAMVAGVISEQSVHLTPVTSRLLSLHQRYAILTGAFAGAAWLARVFARFPRSARSGQWSLFGTGRGRPTVLATVLVLGAAVFVTLTGNVGGTMVYGHGLGVRAPAATRH
jgi:uncharacterized membrane protein